jgi:hypothetical protein
VAALLVRSLGNGSDGAAVHSVTRAAPVWAELELDDGRAAPAKLVVWEGETVDFGRFPKTGVIVDHPAVSRLHATFALSRTGLVVRDSGSKNGTYVNDERVHAASLVSGSTVGFGRSGPKVVVRRAPDLPGPTETERQ